MMIVYCTNCAFNNLFWNKDNFDFQNINAHKSLLNSLKDYYSIINGKKFKIKKIQFKKTTKKRKKLMLTIGIQTSAKFLYYSVFNSENKKIIMNYKISIPQENLMDRPKSYRFLRHSIIDIINSTLIENKKIKFAGLRESENGAKNQNRNRIEMEGVIKESFASSDLLNYSIIKKKEIANQTGILYKNLPSIYTKKISNETLNLLKKEIINWEELSNKYEKETALVAYTASKENNKNER